ncbi:hypothetical protein [Luteolibacter sp. Populi]|uniref:hypothetical protein n=1 Tax=Luteolibacter sp. Populi TaxID=3230487 RepID=UPI003465E695
MGKKLSDYEAKYEIVKVTLAKMPVVTKTGSLHLAGYTIAVPVMCWAKAPPWIIVMFTGVWLVKALIIYYDVRKIGTRARARDRPREPRGSAGGSG